MDLKLENIFEKIINNTELMSEFLKIEDKDSMYKFFLKISGNLSREEFENILEVLSHEKLMLDSNSLEKIAGGFSIRDLKKIVSTGLVPLMSIGAIYPSNAVNVNNNMYVSKDKSSIKKFVSDNAPFAIGSFLAFGSIGGILLANYFMNKLPDFPKIEEHIVSFRDKLNDAEKLKYDACIRSININLYNKIKSKDSNIDVDKCIDASSKFAHTQSGILIFDEEILQIIKNSPKYFESDINSIIGLLNYYLNKEPLYRGLSNAGNYCYLNTAVQLLSADSELSDILSSDKKMRKCFEDFKKHKNSVASKHKALNDDIENFERNAKAKYHEIVDMINDSLSVDELRRILPGSVIDVITSKNVAIGTFYEELFNTVTYDNRSKRWMYPNAIRNKRRRTNTSDVKSVISNLFANDNLKDRFDRLTNEYFEIYNSDPEYRSKIQKRGVLADFINLNISYDTETSEFNNPINRDVNIKLLDMIDFVNAKNDTDSDCGGKELADILKERDKQLGNINNHLNWHHQNDPRDVLSYAVKIPSFIMSNVICSLGDSVADTINNSAGREPYILIISGRSENEIHVTTDFEESIETEDGAKYKLISFACHRGTKRYGHWWTVRKDKSGNWWECNDKRISNAGNSESCLNNANYKKQATYLLYKKVK